MGAGGGNRKGGRARALRAAVASLVLLCLAGVAAPQAAQASQEPDAASESERPVLLPHAIPDPVLNGNTDASQAVWNWPERQWGYFLADGDGGAAWDGFPRIVKVDLETGEELAQEQLSPPAYYGAGPGGTTGQPHTVAVDRAGGRLFVAYQNPPGGMRTTQMGHTNAGRGEVCAGLGVSVAGCVAGVSVLDAVSLQKVRQISLQSVRVDGGALSGHLLDMAWSPPRAEGDAGKLHLLVTEYAHDTVDVVGQVFVRRALATSVVYLVQMDPDTGVQDWAVRVDACRGTREFIDPIANSARPHAAAVFRGQSVADPALFVSCVTSTANTAAVVKVPLDDQGRPAVFPVEAGDPGAVAGQALAEGPDSLSQEDVARQPRGQVSVPGPDKAFEFLAAPAHERIAVRVVEGSGALSEVWWVFDTATMRWVGTIGIGESGYDRSQSGLDPATGRLYVLTPKGLFVGNVGGAPLGQALVYPEFASLGGETGARALVVVPAVGEGRHPRVWVAELMARSGGNRNDSNVWRVIEDRVPLRTVVEVDPYAGRTVDLDEVEGVTSSVMDGAARGFGARVILISGVDGAARVGPADAIGRAYAEWGCDGLSGTVVLCAEAVKPVKPRAESPCTDGDRDLVLAFVGPDGPVVVDGTGARGSAEPLVFDSRSRADFEAAPSRCSGQDWDALWGTALFGSAPAGEPKVPWVFSPRAAACVAPKDGEGSSDRVGDSVAGTFAAGVSCGGEEASGHSYARGVAGDGFGVGEALSSFRVYRDPGRGVVSRVESVARGVSVPGVLRIDTVRGSAESWANGRRQPAAAERDAGYDANCDTERTAGTCFRRHLFGVWTPGYSCGPCGDEKQLPERINRGLGTQASVAFRAPDEKLAQGADNGFIAAVQKPDSERFADLVLNNDLLQTVVPTLEIIRYAPPARGFQGGGPRGRQIIQVAGVEVSSSYGISCLLVYDAAANTCAGEKQEPGAIHVSLSDPDGKALAGGAFEVRADVDADGVLGLKDTLLPNGACVTTDDGVGTCKFEALQPGSYLVNQVAAPPGYAKSAEPFVVELASGEQRTVAFTNVSNVSTVELKAADENGQPVSGAVFAAYPDPDSDGKVAPDAKPAAECTTGADGACSMKVPAGSYVLVQTSAPAGLEGIEPVAFTFASGGQVAAVTVVNYPPEHPTVPEPAAAPEIGYTPPVDAMPPTEIVDDYTPPDIAPQPETAEPPVLAQVGDTITQVIRAPGDALRLLARDPKQAVAWTAALALFCLAAMAVRRRQQALALMG